MFSPEGSPGIENSISYTWKRSPHLELGETHLEMFLLLKKPFQINNKTFFLRVCTTALYYISL